MHRLLLGSLVALTHFSTPASDLPQSFCREINSASLRQPVLVGMLGGKIHPIGDVLDLGDVHAAPAGADKSRFYLVVSVNHQADAELPGREYAIIPSEKPIKCGRRWAYEVDFDFSESIILPGRFDRNIAIFSRTVEGVPGAPAATTKITGYMRRPWVSVKEVDRGEGNVYNLSVTNIGNIPTSAISVFFDIGGTWEVQLDKCDGKVLQTGDRCELQIREGARKSPRQLLIVSDDQHAPWRFSVNHLPTGQGLQILP